MPFFPSDYTIFAKMTDIQVNTDQKNVRKPGWHHL